MRHLGCSLLILACASAVGCATGPQNPTFPLTSDAAAQALKDMEAHPKPLARPLVIVGGFLDFGLGPAGVKRRIHKVTNDDRIVTVSLFTCGDFDDCRAAILDAVGRAFPGEEPEVDVIGISMGGIAARYAAARPVHADGTRCSDACTRPARRLRVARMFTLGSPHQGAVLAGLPAVNRLHRDMRHGSQFLNELNAAGADYPIYPYVRLSDGWVGESNAALPGRVAWWLPACLFQDSHTNLPTDTRVLADIARRLRGEEPFTKDPPAPLPN